MSVVGWARIATGSALLAVGTYLTILWEGAPGFLGVYTEHLEYFGYGYDQVFFLQLPVKFVLIVAFLFAGYRLLRRAEVT